MSKFKGTKRKWVVAKANMKDTNLDELVVSVDGGEKTKEGYRLIACISPFEKHDEIDLANALLISKAPEMLEMLQDILEQENISQSAHDEITLLIKQATEL